MRSGSGALSTRGTNLTPLREFESNGYLFYPQAFRNLEYNIEKASCRHSPTTVKYLGKSECGWFLLLRGPKGPTQ